MIWIWAIGVLVFGWLAWRGRVNNSDWLDYLILIVAVLIWPITFVWAMGINIRGFWRAFR